MTPGGSVSLRPVTRADVRAVCNLELGEGQRHLVAPATYTVAEGNYEPGALLRAIYRGERPVGVLLVEVGGGTPYLMRVMVDAREQGAGIGRTAVELLLDELRAGGWSTVETSYFPGADGPAEFWRRCGFRPTGRKLHGEPVVVRDPARALRGRPTVIRDSATAMRSGAETGGRSARSRRSTRRGARAAPAARRR